MSNASRKRALPASLRVAVLSGASRAGLPLALVLADRGHHVTLIDDEKRIEGLRKGQLPFLEAGGGQILARCLQRPECLELTSAVSSIRGCTVVVLTITTPVDERLTPDSSMVDDTIRNIKPWLQGGETLVLRSAVSPGTSERLQRSIGSELSEVGVSFCPERLATSQAIQELTQVPQIVSASSARAMDHIKTLFAPLGVDMVELSILEAEVATLFLNAWRYVGFGAANQFYQIALSKGLDFDKIRSAIMHRYERAAGFPSSGFTAGPLLYQDTMQLAAYCRHTFSLGNAAVLVNETMPDSLVEQARKQLLSQGRTLQGLKCGILGMAFKPDSDVCSQSLALKLKQLLQREGAEVACSDACVPPEAGLGCVGEEELLEPLGLSNQGLARSICCHVVDHQNMSIRMILQPRSSEAIFIGCPHTRYRSLPLQGRPLVFDCWGFTHPPELVIWQAGKVGEMKKDRKSLRVAVVGGAGHVGLPLSLAFVQCGHAVTIVDKDAQKLASIKAGKFPFLEAGGAALLQHCLDKYCDKLEFSTSVAGIRDCNVVVVTIGTPVDEHLNPCFQVIQECVNELKPFLRDGQTLLLRSTVFPGTSSRVLADLRKSGLQGSELDVGVSFCPERIAQGKAIEELMDLPQIVSGSDKRSLDHAKALFAPLGVDLIELQLQEAEAAKLFLNSWRYIAFGTANQFYHIASSKGLDFERLRAAIVHRYPRGKDFPRSGFTAGPCLFKDTMQLAAYCRHTFSLGHSAMLVNETMPDCIVEHAKRDLAQSKRTLAAAKCGILGMAFKPDNDDWRESLAFKLRRLLVWEGADVLCTDVYLAREGFVGLGSLLADCELLFVGCPHSEYRDIALRQGQRIYDCWGFFTKPSLTISSP